MNESPQRVAARMRAIAHRLDVAIADVEAAGRPGYARKLREDAAYLRTLAGPRKAQS